MKKYTIPQSMTVEYMLGDQLGSTSITTDTTGAKVSEMRYRVASRRDEPWGEIRYSEVAENLSTTPAYYFAGATRLAVRTNGTLSYLLSDHPSTSPLRGEVDFFQQTPP